MGQTEGDDRLNADLESMNTPRERFGINSLGALLFAGALIAALVLGALAMDALWMLIGGVIVLGVITVVLARIGVNLFAKWTEARVKTMTLNYDHDERMARIGYLPAGHRYDPIHQLLAPPPERETKEEPIDPRHELLVNLCLLTIKSDRYGPTSKKLMTADDAQADRSGQFSDRMNWDAASKYGQSVLGLLYARVGGKPEEQGLRIKGDNGTDGTAADLLVALHGRARTDAAVNALPGISR